MTTTRWPHAVVTAVFAMSALLGLAGCDTSIDGNPQPVSTTSSTQPPVNNPVGERDAAAKLAAIDPCTLLTPAQIDQYGLRKKEVGELAGARQCGWSHPSDDHGKGGYAVGPAIRDHQGLRDINTDGYTMTDQPVGRHQGRQAQQDGDAGCLVSIGVTESARVDIAAAGEPGTACQVANQFATLMEPLLPGGST
jgi:hypothetical protein